MIQFASNWTMVDKMSFLERKILLNSILYYDYNTNIISDFHYNEISQQLAQMIKERPTLLAKSRYGYAFKGFEGSTGFDLFAKLTKEDQLYLRSIVDYQQGTITLSQLANNVVIIDAKTKGKLF